MSDEESILKKYDILNSIKPYFSKTKYPFSTLSDEKLIMYKKKIQILVKDIKARPLKPKPASMNPKSGGSTAMIVFYD